jgi:hypothetical protein
MRSDGGVAQSRSPSPGETSPAARLKHDDEDSCGPADFGRRMRRQVDLGFVVGLILVLLLTVRVISHLMSPFASIV